MNAQPGKDFTWPLDRTGDRVLVCLADDAELLAPVLDGVAEPEDNGTARIVPLGIRSLEVSSVDLAAELEEGPDDVWLVLEASERAQELWFELFAARASADLRGPAACFLPAPLTLAEVVKALPSGRETTMIGRPTRWRLLNDVLVSLYVASAPDEWLAAHILAQAGGRHFR